MNTVFHYSAKKPLNPLDWAIITTVTYEKQKLVIERQGWATESERFGDLINIKHVFDQSDFSQSYIEIENKRTYIPNNQEVETLHCIKTLILEDLVKIKNLSEQVEWRIDCPIEPKYDFKLGTLENYIDHATNKITTELETIKKSLQLKTQENDSEVLTFKP